MEQPPDLPPQPVSVIDDEEVTPAPLWVRLLAGAADSIVAGLCSLAMIVVILIPYFYPETQTIIYDYAQQSQGSVAANTELARSLIEKPAMREMLFASQMILYTVFCLYYLINEWTMKGSSLGKKIFRISTVRYHSEEDLSISTIFLRAWLKTVFLLLLLPILWMTFTWAFVQKDKRTVHDLITGTWVVD
jgi:uncharacterized RDD family membrane protein YckC